MQLIHSFPYKICHFSSYIYNHMTFEAVNIWRN